MHTTHNVAYNQFQKTDFCLNCVSTDDGTSDSNIFWCETAQFKMSDNTR